MLKAEPVCTGKRPGCLLSKRSRYTYQKKYIILPRKAHLPEDVPNNFFRSFAMSFESVKHHWTNALIIDLSAYIYNHLTSTKSIDKKERITGFYGGNDFSLGKSRQSHYIFHVFTDFQRHPGTPPHTTFA